MSFWSSCGSARGMLVGLLGQVVWIFRVSLSIQMFWLCGAMSSGWFGRLELWWSIVGIPLSSSCFWIARIMVVLI